VFAAEQQRYYARADNPHVLGITYRGDARRRNFALRLARQGQLTIGCVDLLVDPCRDLVSLVMRDSGLRATEFGAVEHLPGDHMLRLIRVTPAVAEQAAPR
jgi:hypothetical protein